MALSPEDLARVERAEGRARNGRVGIREFDHGVILTMRPERLTTQRTAGFGENYFLTGVNDLFPDSTSQPPDYPGVPIIFAIPEDVFEEWRIPVVVVRRNSIEPALNRWHPGQLQYRAPALGATPVSTTDPLSGEVVEGFDSYEESQQAVPYDIEYEIRVLARNRGGRNQSSPRNQANSVFMYLASIFQPYCGVFVKDTIGDLRSYHATAQYGVEDEVIEVTERMIGYTITLLVEAQLDLNQAQVYRAATQFPTLTVDIDG